MLPIALLAAAALACGPKNNFGQAPAPLPPPPPYPVEPLHVLPKPPADGGEPMKAMVPSAMRAELEAIGVDPMNLPPLDKIAPDKLRKVMGTFTKALGFRCTDCHLDDYSAPTRNKAIAKRMWDEFTRGLAMQDGAPLYCDSCHQARPKLLDRRDATAMETWMRENFVAKLKRTDGNDHGCATCHGEPFDKVIIKKWAQL